MASEDQQPLILPIIDSHIHLWREDDAHKLSWWKPDTGFDGPHTIQQFKAAARSSPSLLGFIAVECHPKVDLALGEADGSGWENPLDEVAKLARIALGKPEEGDGADPEDGKLCLAIVPWAPMPSGAEVLERYIARVKEVAGDAWPKVKGFRYLVQDKPHGTMLEKKFIDSLKLLGRKGLLFEVGVDHHQRGKKQLDELLVMIEQAHEGVPEEEKVTLVISKSISQAPLPHTALKTMYTPIPPIKRQKTLMNSGCRPSRQTQLRHPQPVQRSLLRRLAHHNLHPRQVLQHLHAALRRFLRDVPQPQEPVRLRDL